MGRTAVCHATLDRDAGEAKAMLESDHLLLRGDLRATLPLSTLRNVRTEGDLLRAETGLGPLVLVLGEREATLWAKKILSPPSLAQKLGVAPDTAIHVVDDPEVLRPTLGAIPATHVALEEATVVFALFDRPQSLDTLPGLAERMQPQTQLWAIRPKGPKALPREADLMAALRALGFRPNKTAAWSAMHAADRYRR
jgi:hypothetical protein